MTIFIRFLIYDILEYIAEYLTISDSLYFKHTMYPIILPSYYMPYDNSCWVCKEMILLHSYHIE